MQMKAVAIRNGSNEPELIERRHRNSYQIECWYEQLPSAFVAQTVIFLYQASPKHRRENPT